MQDILHASIIAVPVVFAVFMILDLIANLKQLWIACKPSTPDSIPASTQQPLPEVVAPAEEPEELEIMPDPWALELTPQPIVSTPKLTLVRSNLLLLPATKTSTETVEASEAVTATTKHKAGKSKKQVTPAPVVVPAKRRGRPRKSA